MVANGTYPENGSYYRYTDQGVGTGIQPARMVGRDTVARKW